MLRTGTVGLKKYSRCSGKSKRLNDSVVRKDGEEYKPQHRFILVSYEYHELMR
jgi:hypothetical protein